MNVCFVDFNSDWLTGGCKQGQATIISPKHGQKLDCTLKPVFTIIEGGRLLFISPHRCIQGIQQARVASLARQSCLLQRLFQASPFHLKSSAYPALFRRHHENGDESCFRYDLTHKTLPPPRHPMRFSRCFRVAGMVCPSLAGHLTLRNS